MLEHDPNQLETTAIPNLPSETVSGSAYIEGYLDGYLDQVCAPLKAAMPEARSNEYRAEMRIHLKERIAAYQELGATPEQAIADALRQFGDSGYIARHWQQECERTVPTAVLEQSTRTALCYFGIAALMQSGLSLILFQPSLRTLPLPFFRIIWGLWLFGLPTVAGSAVGLRAKRPVYGTLSALGLLFLPLMLFNQLWAYLLFHLHLFTVPDPSQAGALEGILQFTGLMLAGSVSACNCSLLRRVCTRLRNRLALR
jgi:hypothetical protein